MTDLAADLVVVGASEVITCEQRDGDPLGRIPNGAVAVRAGRVVWTGPVADLPSIDLSGPEVDAAGRAVVPGFVDAHTHLVFAGERRQEFAARARGESYQAGGILKTVRDTRGASGDDLTALAVTRAQQMLMHGTTTAEAKSGYALDVEGELRLLQVLAEVHNRSPLDLEITFLGAHAVPEEFSEDPEGFVELVVHEMTPRCAPHAAWCDVFCDVGAFTAEQAIEILSAGIEAGLTPRIHANELGPSGGAEVAAGLGAASADHLLYLDETQARLLAIAGCVGVVCPTTALSLGRFPDVGLMKDAGMVVAIASDLNPGMAPAGNLQFAMSIATRAMGMSQEDALLAVTTGGAKALQREDIGRIAEGCAADLLILDTDSAQDLGYIPGVNLVDRVIKRGEVCNFDVIPSRTD